MERVVPSKIDDENSMTKNGLTAEQISRLVDGNLRGDGGRLLDRVADLAIANASALAFIDDPKFWARAQKSDAGCILVAVGAQVEHGCVIEVAQPKMAFARAAAVIMPEPRFPPSIHPTAIVDETARLGENVFLGPYVTVGPGASIGDRAQLHQGVALGAGVSVGCDCVFYPQVTVYSGAIIGTKVILHAGAVIGADGFGYVRDTDGYEKFPQVGGIVIEDEVEIGANTCIDRGSLGQTRIGKGTKIDNLVQIAHNVEIGERVVIASQTGVSGSTVIESDAVIGGQVGLGDHARVQSGAIIGSKAGVLPGKIVRPGVWWGVPVQPLDQYKRLHAHIGRLPQTREELKKLQQQVADLAAKLAELTDPKDG
jgi:UDP-3-O-[3-hydroxymyristoyl] glucosamine N-acyltransferase